MMVLKLLVYTFSSSQQRRRRMITVTN